MRLRSLLFCDFCFFLRALLAYDFVGVVTEACEDKIGGGDEHSPCSDDADVAVKGILLSGDRAAFSVRLGVVAAG